jgi:prefoldin subunit 5
MKLQFLAIPLLVALLFSPLASAAAATGTISFSSPAAGAHYSAGTSYTIAGTITPTPSLPDNVFIEVTSQSTGTVVDATNVAVQAGGAFSYATAAGSNFATGTYVITATDSNGATGTEDISVTGTGGGSTSSTGVVTIEAPTLVLPGQPANVWIYSSAPGTVTAWVLAAGSSTATTITATRVSPNPGGLYVYSATYSVAATAANGAYLVGALVVNSTTSPTFAASNIGTFTVNGGVAQQSTLTSIMTALTGIGSNTSGLSKSVATLTASLATLNSEVTALQASAASLTSSLGAVNTNVNSISSSVSTLSASVSTLSTNVGTLMTDVTGLQTTVNTLSSTVSTLSTSVSSITSSISTLTTDVTNLQTSVTNLGNLSGQMATLQTSLNNLNSSVSNTQTYILVAAVLVVITLVLELAILIRKLS